MAHTHFCISVRIDDSLQATVYCITNTMPSNAWRAIVWNPHDDLIHRFHEKALSTSQSHYCYIDANEWLQSESRYTLPFLWLGMAIN